MNPRLVTVVVPVRNERDDLPPQLESLTRQTYDGEWEVVVVDDGSTDGTGDLARSFSSRLPALRVIETAPPHGLNRARNAGVDAARGEVVAFCDGDDVASPGWLAALVAGLDDADLVGGPLEFTALNDPLVRSWRSRIPWPQKRFPNGFFQYVPGCNCALRTDLARRLRWDESFRFGASDGEFSWRAQLLAYRVAVAPEAVIHMRFPETPWGIARQFYGYGRGEPQLYRRERRHGLPRSDTRAALREYADLILGAGDLIRSRRHRGVWLRRAALRAGRLRGSLRARVLYL